MIKIETIKDIYPAIDELIRILADKNNQQQELAKVLKHRMYEVSWTSGSELYAELKNILQKFIVQKNLGIDKSFLEQMEHIIETIDGWEKSRKIQWIKPGSKDWGKTDLDKK